ncbi:MAG: hypothetical protein RL604_1534, partial [Pseudomonadota bacterium]
MSEVGYSKLKTQLNLSAFDPLMPARLAPVTSVTTTQSALLIPVKVAPKDETLLSHLLFALKHEGIN